DAARKRKKVVVKRAAVQQDGLVRAAETGSELIHDTDAGTDELIFGTLAELCNFRKVKGSAGNAKQRACDRHFERSGGTQTCSHWNIAVDQNVSAPQSHAVAHEHQCDTVHVVRPVVLRARLRVAQINFSVFVQIFRMNVQLPIITRSDRSPSIKIDCGWQYKAVIVIGVLSDQIDAAGGTEDARGGRKSLYKAFAKPVHEVHAISQLNQVSHCQKVTALTSS